MKKKISNKQLAIALYEATKGLVASDLKKALVEFVAILARERKLKKADYIIAEYVKYAKVQDGVRQIEITSARELDDKVLNHIKKAFGDKVEAEVKVDASLLGGVRVKTDDKILDASLRTQLNKLKHVM